MEEKPVSIAVSGEAHKLFAAVCKGSVGRSMNDAATRLLRWFCRQEDFVQTAVMSAVDRGMEGAYADALRKLADEIERGIGFNAAVDHVQTPESARDQRIKGEMDRRMKRNQGNA